MRRARAIVPVLVLLLGACDGPSTPLEVGVREIDTDVLIGPRAATPAASLPPSFGPPPGFPGFVQPPPPSIDPPPSPPPPPVPCPSAHPLSPILHPVTSSVGRPPVPAGYRFRNDGTYSLDGDAARFPASTTRLVKNVAPEDEGEFTFEMTARSADARPTTTRYRVVPQATQPPTTDPGIYIEQVTTLGADGTPHHFTPVPSLMLMRLPAAIGQTWTARGIDPQTQTLMQFAGKTTARTFVDACGVRLEAWQVEITDGVVRSPFSDLTFSAGVAIATQYGGVSIADSLRMQGIDRGMRLDSTNRARISQEPELPR